MRIMNTVDALPSSVTSTPSQAPERRQAAAAQRAVEASQAAQAARQQREGRRDADELKEAVESANKSLATRNAQVQFAMDSDSGRMLVKLVDVETRKVLRQIPNEEMLRIAKNIDRMRGVGVNQAA